MFVYVVVSTGVFFSVVCGNELTTHPNFGVPSVHQLTTPFEYSTSPFWDHRKQVLYFVDPKLGKLLNYNYVSKAINSINLDGPVSSVVPSKNDDKILFLGVNNSIMAVDWDGQKSLDAQKVIVKLTDQFSNNTLINGKADKHGRLWVGTKNSVENSNSSANIHDIKESFLYKVTKNDLSHPAMVMSSSDMSNGIVWNAANDKMYFVDSQAKKIFEFDYSDEAGTLSGNRTVFDVAQNSDLGGFPDGIAIDAEDNLWVALNGGGAVVKVNPRDGKVMQVIALPAQDVTSATWGGPSMDILFVTTSRGGRRRPTEPAAGSVFAVTGTGARGLPDHLGDIFDGPIPKVTHERELHRHLFDFSQYATGRAYDHQTLEIESNSLQEPVVQITTTTALPSTTAKIFVPLLSTNFLQKRTQAIIPENPLWSSIMQAAQNFRNFFVRSK